jgi:hypothetical protein
MAKYTSLGHFSGKSPQEKPPGTSLDSPTADAAAAISYTISTSNDGDQYKKNNFDL